VLTAADLICWAELICFAHVPSLARCEIAAFRYQVLHVATQLTRSAAAPGCASIAPGDGPPRSPMASAGCAPPSPDRNAGVPSADGAGHAANQ
jgi:hypothetical protein